MNTNDGYNSIVLSMCGLVAMLVAYCYRWTAYDGFHRDRRTWKRPLSPRGVEVISRKRCLKLGKKATSICKVR